MFFSFVTYKYILLSIFYIFPSGLELFFLAAGVARAVLEVRFVRLTLNTFYSKHSYHRFLCYSLGFFIVPFFRIPWVIMGFFRIPQVSLVFICPLGFFKIYEGSSRFLRYSQSCFYCVTKLYGLFRQLGQKGLQSCFLMFPIFHSLHVCELSFFKALKKPIKNGEKQCIMKMPPFILIQCF